MTEERQLLTGDCFGYGARVRAALVSLALVDRGLAQGGEVRLQGRNGGEPLPEGLGQAVMGATLDPDARATQCLG